MAEGTNLSLNDTVKGVTSTLTKDKLLNVGRLDLATVVDDLASGVNDNLGRVESMSVNLRIADGDENLSSLGCSTNASHFVRVGSKTVLVVLLEQRQRVLVVDAPLPVGISLESS